MSIIEQVKELRELADGYKLADKPLAANTMYQAADTIESLSAKLQAANMERPEETSGDMTLSEAIEHLDEILQPDRKWDCEECKNEHIQLREWLVELKGYRERSADCGGWIPCKERLPEEKINPITQDFYEYQATFQSENIKDIRHYKFGRGHWWNGPGIMDEYVIARRQRPSGTQTAPESVRHFRQAMKLMCIICHVHILGKVVDEKGRRW